MTRYDDAGELVDTRRRSAPRCLCSPRASDLEVRDITFAEAPNWGLHMLGCDGVLVDNVKVRNLLDVPNCDGIDPDHSRNVEIRNCDLVCGDDGVVIKCQPPAQRLRPVRATSACRTASIETQDAGLKIGTETTVRHPRHAV